MDENQQKVLATLREYKSMAFLELAAVLDADEEQLKKTIQEMESQGLVKVSNRGNILNEIITLRELAFAAGY